MSTLHHEDLLWDIFDEVCGYAEFSFNTAWAPADGIYKAIVDKYPDVGISWFYDEPGCELAGYLPD